MESDKKPDSDAAKPAEGGANAGQSAPQDALERSNEDLAKDAPVESTPADGLGPDGKPLKKPSGLKLFFKRFNVYLLLFLLIIVIAGAVTMVSYLNSKKAPKTPTVATQNLTSDTLKQLSNSDATVGDTGQTLTVQGNAVFSGQVLVRSDLNVAGTIKLGGPLSVPQLMVSGTTSLAATQVNSLQVANGTTLQGIVTVQNDLNVAGAASFSGAVTAGQITVTKLILSGNAQLQVPNHIAFPGASPGRSINQTTLGAGGTASINGSDTTGTVNINSGNNPAAGCFISVTFAKAFTANPHVVLTPVGSAAGLTQYYVTHSTTGFSVCTNNAAPANQAFGYDYFITD
jgi:cytoskeletal protein CcmA (bactofilin family)